MSDEQSDKEYGLTIDRLSSTRQAKINRYRLRFLEFWEVLRNDWSAMISLGIIIIFTILAIFAPEIAPYDPQTSLSNSQGEVLRLMSPSLSHPFGTTRLARDVLSQWIYGTRVSLLVGFLSGLAVMFIGSTIGLIAGYYKGRTDTVLMRVVDILYGIPATPFVLVLVMFVGPSVWNIVLAMTLLLWRTMARIIRSETRSLSQRPFVKTAKAAGASDLRIIYSHIVPNVVPLIMVETTIAVAWAIALEAGISFLGLGSINMISWGTMLQLTFSSGAIRSAWWWVLPPGIGIMLLVLSVFYLSRTVEKISNPELEK